MPASNASQHASVVNNPVIAILAYCGSSILMTVTNKYVLAGRGFNLNFFLLCVQSAVCIAAIQSLKISKVITFRDFHVEDARRWMPVALLLIGMIYTSTKALAYLSIPVYTIFKNLTTPMVAYIELLWFHGSPVTGLSLVSFALMVLSSMVAAWADIQHAISGDSAEKLSTLNAGYMWMFLNCACTATFLLGMKRQIKKTNFKDFDTMFYNNLLSIPILLLCSILFEDWSPSNITRNFPPEQRHSIILAMVISGLSSVFISYSSAWAVRVTTSTTYSMVGALNKLPLSIIGLLFFDAAVTVGSVSAILLGVFSGLVYAYAKVRVQEEAKRGVLPVARPVELGDLDGKGEKSGR